MSKLHGNRVEIGTLSTSAKNSLGSVPNGTIVYDTDLNEIQYYNPQGWLPISTGQNINATGGSISNSSSFTVERAHCSLQFEIQKVVFLPETFYILI